MSKQENNTILRAGGLNEKKGRSPTMTIAFPVDMMERIKALSVEKCITKGEVVRQLIIEGLKQDNTTEIK